MKRLAGALIFLFLAAGYVYAVDSGSVPAAQQPIVREKIGSGKIFLEAAVYPEFTDLTPANADPWCTPDNPKVFDYLKGKDIRTKSNSPNLKEGWPNHENARIRLLLGTNPKSVVTTEPWPDGRDLDPTKLGVQKTDLVMKFGPGKDEIKINPLYRETAKILVTWTTRIEGECPNWHIGHFICEPYTGSLAFVCPKGKVTTWLQAKYEVTGEDGKVTTFDTTLGQPVIIEMPVTVTKSRQSDPTLTGTYVITKDDFPDKKIPEKLTLQVYWKNETSMYITSPDGMRNMIINVIPFSKIDTADKS